MQMQTISNIFRNCIFASGGDAILLVCGMHWCFDDTKGECGEVRT